jgi:hypothetical protein
MPLSSYGEEGAMVVQVIGRSTGGRPINLSQLESEFKTAGITTSGGLGMAFDAVHTYADDGEPADFPTAEQASVDECIAAHVALRDVTDAEYAAEFQDAATTAVRRQEIRDITSGLLPREQVRVDNGQPIDEPVPQADPLEAIRAVPLGSTTDELRDVIVAYLERFGG